MTQHDKALIFEGLYGLIVEARECAFTDFAAVDDVALRASLIGASYCSKGSSLSGEGFVREFFENMGEKAEIDRLAGEFMEFFARYEQGDATLDEIWLELFGEDCHIRED